MAGRGKTVKSSERQSQISVYLGERGYASLSDLMAKFGVSVSTIRRDLDEMQQNGIVKRTHGGAIHVEAREHPLDYGLREAKNIAEKQAIGDLAASLVCDGDSILLDGGTTTFRVAERLLGRSVQVVTNSLPIAALLSRRSETEVVFLGGSIIRGTSEALGHWAEQMLRTLHIGAAIIGVAGVTEVGFFNANLLMVELQRQMIEASDQLIVVVDHSKFGRRSLVRLCELSKADQLVTDDKVSPEWIELLRKNDVKVHTAHAADEMSAGAVGGPWVD